MRPLALLAAPLLLGAACVTALAEHRGAPAAAPAKPDSPPSPAPSLVAVARMTRVPRTFPLSSPPPLPRAPREEHPPLPRAPVAADPGLIFLNTYYELPVETSGTGDTAVRSRRCEPIALVPRAFHDRLCVQGSGQLASGAIVSFAQRDCACADVCPRTGQRICYDALDPARFPNGRGATGRPITPLSTVAVDPAVIPMGSALYIPDLAGLPRLDGSPHDGCFVAEDQGIKIKGHRIDIFAGDEGTRRRWESLVPSNRGVRVLVGEPRCGRGAKHR